MRTSDRRNGAGSPQVEDEAARRERCGEPAPLRRSEVLKGRTGSFFERGIAAAAYFLLRGVDASHKFSDGRSSPRELKLAGDLGSPSPFRTSALRRRASHDEQGARPGVAAVAGIAVAAAEGLPHFLRTRRPH